MILYIHSIYGILYMYITKYGCVFLKFGESIYVAMGASPPSRTTGPRCLYVYIYIYMYLCIGYTLGSQCIPGIYARWFLITHEGVARGRYHKPLRVFPGIHGYLGYNQFVG